MQIVQRQSNIHFQILPLNCSCQFMYFVSVKMKFSKLSDQNYNELNWTEWIIMNWTIGLYKSISHTAISICFFWRGIVVNELQSHSLSWQVLVKAKLFTKNFSKNFNLDGPGISLPVFPSRTNLKLHTIKWGDLDSWSYLDQTSKTTFKPWIYQFF